MKKISAAVSFFLKKKNYDLLAASFLSDVCMLTVLTVGSDSCYGRILLI